MQKFLASLRSLIKVTSFWKENYVFLREFKYFWGVAVLAIIFSFLGAIFEGAALAVINAFLQVLTSPDKPPVKLVFEWLNLWVFGAQSNTSDRLLRLGLLVICLAWLRSLFAYLGPVYAQLTDASFADRMRKSMFEQLISLNLGYYSQTRSGDLINILNSEIATIQRGFGAASAFAIRVSTLLVYIVAMFLISWQLSIISLALFGMLSVIISSFVARVREASFPVSQAGADFTSTGIELISAMRTIKTSSTQNFERTRFYKVSEQVKQALYRLNKSGNMIRPLSEAISTTILISVIVTAFNIFVVSGQLQTASLLTFMFVLFRMMPLVEQVNGLRVELGSYGGSIAKIKGILATEDKIYLKDGELEFTALKNSIDFFSVDFSYNALDNPVLHDINLSIKRGQTTALVGTSGAGKTTLADLIPRLYDPTNGMIFIDGIDLKDLKISSLRNRMAIVSQSTFIFNASVRYNIAYGVDDIDEDLVVKVAEQANALDFILDMPQGFDTVLGDRGVRLSGGQCQRIAIARALLRKPDILILDEATSALDSVTERLIQESLDRLSKGCTVIAIAHRLSTIVRADKVVVIEKGRIVEQGKYQELIERKGALWKYHQMQNSSEQG
ncbi:lipid A export ATP-binding/permease protein MsbA [Pseudanabaena sp. lw0831]|uniref:heterocyst formation ABC transporter subunit HepA n=1 Tax=Pseudanabaena sp. lw0831 TaxID=1357935 RepID=UPI001914F177|nr:heterocyst formation ABC transporter subunit HepA [Pseudanabaena sp. lw0831]GBO53849.1 lipid A export ATP-binding/permease protein MsbA [Pseudanabaena sp. lw0831]